MEKTILVAGKNMPECAKFCEALSSGGKKVSATSAELENFEETKKTVAERKAQMLSYNESKNIEAQSGICTFEWNKASALSTRSLILQTENFFGGLDEAILYFDEEWFSSHAQKMDAEEVSRCADEMILGFQNLTLELLNRFEKKYSDSPFTLIFVLNECPCVADALRLPSLRNGSVAIASPLVASAASAFSSFAENIAAMFGDSPFVNIVLVRDDYAHDKTFGEAEKAKWFLDYLNEISQLKNKLSAKKSMQWIKVGSKISNSVFENFSLGKLNKLFKK